MVVAFSICDIRGADLIERESLFSKALKAYSTNCGVLPCNMILAKFPQHGHLLSTNV